MDIFELCESDAEAAIPFINERLNDNLEDAEALFLMAYIFLKADRLGLAYNLLKRVVELAPNRPEAWTNLGRCLQTVERIPEARGYFLKAIEEASYLDEPDKSEITARNFANLAVLAINEFKPEKALELCKEASKYGDIPQINENRALANLALRNWGQGWDDYDVLLGQHKAREAKVYVNEPVWNKESGTVVVYGEQGLGDEIMFSSCIPDMRDDAAIIMDCDKRLEGLFRRSFPYAHVYGTRKAEQISWPLQHKIDYSVAIGSLPKFYRRKGADFPGDAYLKACPDRRLQWRALFDTLPGLKVGIAWNGGRKNTGEYERSIPIEMWQPILEQGCTFISLEYKDHEDIEGIKKYSHGTLTQDYDDTAALVSELDLVISVTTTVIHLAGALGVECWCLTPDKSNWRFPKNGPLPWHNSVKLYRENGNWFEAIEKVSKKLHERIVDSRPRSKSVA